MLKMRKYEEPRSKIYFSQCTPGQATANNQIQKKSRVPDAIYY